MSIKRGDWVVIERPSMCCGSIKTVGRIFNVQDVSHPHTGGCTGCFKAQSVNAALQPNGMWIDMRRLRRIDPPATGEYDGVPVRKQIPRKVTA